MCQRKPGPRCADHARQQLAKAREALASDPQNAELQHIVARAKHEYDLTDTGRKEIQAEVKRLSDSDPVAAAKVQKQLDDLNDEYAHRERERNQLVEDPSSAETIAASTNTPIMLDYLATHEDPYVRYLVAMNRSAPDEALTLLAADEDDRVRMEVARRSHASRQVRLLSAADPNKDIRHALSVNTSAPDAALAVLATDSEYNIRANVVRHPNTSEETFGVLAADEKFGIRMDVAGNSRTPATVLARLVSEQGPTEEVARLRMEVASNPNASSESLAVIATDPHEQVRSVVLLHPNTSLSTVARLTSDDNARLANRAKDYLADYSNAELLQVAGLPHEDADSLPREWVVETIAAAA